MTKCSERIEELKNQALALEQYGELTTEEQAELDDIEKELEELIY